MYDNDNNNNKKTSYSNQENYPKSPNQGQGIKNELPKGNIPKNELPKGDSVNINIPKSPYRTDYKK